MDIRASRTIPLLAETSCRFLGELSFPEEVSVGIGIERLGRTSAVFRLGLFSVVGDRVNPDLRALGRFAQVYVDSITRRPVPIPGEIRRALETLASVSASPKSS